MRDHRLTRDRVHDLGDCGFHSCAAAGGEDDGGETGLAHRLLEGTDNLSGCTLAWRRRTHNSQIVAEYSTTTQSLSRCKGSSSSSISMARSSTAYRISAPR